MTEDRYIGVIHDITDKLVRPAGYEEVDLSIKLQHFFYILPRLHKLDPAGGYSRRFRCLRYNFRQNTVCLKRLASPLQQYGISAFQTEGRHLHKRVRP